MKKYGLLLIAVYCIWFGAAPFFWGIVRTGSFLLLSVGVSAAVCALWRPSARPGVRTVQRILSSVLAVELTATAALSAWMMYAAWLSPPGEKPVTVVVLGCQVLGGQPSLMLRRRIDTAAAYLLTHPEAPVVATGGFDPAETLSEAQVIARELAALGVQESRIYRDDHATDTKENLQNAARLIETHALPPTVATATDGFHQLRARLYARQNGLTPRALPAPTPWALLPSYWAREWLGIAELLLFGG